MAHICKMIISPGVLLNFLKILMFRVFSEVKWPKNVERSILMMGEVSRWWEKYLLKYLSMVEVSLEVSRWWEEYLSKRSPLKHSCSWHDKLIVLWILNRQAKIFLHMAKKWPKISENICHAPYLRNHTWYSCHLWYSSANQ